MLLSSITVVPEVRLLQTGLLLSDGVIRRKSRWSCESCYKPKCSQETL